MIETPLAPKVWATLPTAELALLEQVATLRRENAALRAENTALQARIRKLEARLDQPLSADMYAAARVLAA